MQISFGQIQRPVVNPVARQVVRFGADKKDDKKDTFKPADKMPLKPTGSTIPAEAEEVLQKILNHPAFKDMPEDMRKQLGDQTREQYNNGELTMDDLKEILEIVNNTYKDN